MKIKINRYRFHLILGLCVLPALIISAGTGFFRANYKWFWKENYKKVKNFTYDYHIEKPDIGIDSIYSLVNYRFGQDVKISEIRLRKEIGMLLYDVRIEKQAPILIDAHKGKVLNPLTKDLAICFASQYVKPEYKIKDAYLDNNYLTRKDKKTRPVYIVEYADDLHTKILIDKNNGEIEEEIDDNLKFGFLMVKLHDYDFWNLKRSILSIVGISLTILGISGFYLWLRKRKSNKRKKIKG